MNFTDVGRKSGTIKAANQVAWAQTGKRGKPAKPPFFSKACLNGRHYSKCFSPRCMCECHRSGH